MSAITEKEVEHIAGLARIKLTEKEKDKMTKELGAILGYIDKLKEVDTAGVEPVAHITGLENIMRRDELLVGGEGYISSVHPHILEGANLKPGDLIKTPGFPEEDIFMVNEHGYKRFILRPIFLKFFKDRNIKNVSPQIMNSLPTSGFLKQKNTSSVYGIELTGEQNGILHLIDVPTEEALSQDHNFLKKIFEIEEEEFKYFKKGFNYTSLVQVPSYARAVGAPADSVINPLVLQSPSSEKGFVKVKAVFEE